MTPGLLERRKPDWETSIYLLLAVVNLALGCFLIHTSPVEIIADADQYYEISKALVGKVGHLYNERTNWGYPILLLLTGFPWTRWPLITQVVQVCMASAIPYFVGSSLRQVGAESWIRISAAVLSFLAFPTVFAIALLTNTYSEFLLYFTIWLVARALVRVEGVAGEAAIHGKIQWRMPAAIGAAFFMLYLARTENLVLGLIGLGVGVATTTKAARAVMLRAFGVFVALTLIWVPVQRGWTAWAESKQTQVTGGSLTGILFFRSVYSGGSAIVGRSVIRPENGPCSSRVYKSVEKNVATIGNSTREYDGRSPATTDEVFSVRDTTNVAIVFESVEHDFGPDEATSVLWCAAFEGIYAEPKSLLYYYDALIGFFLYDDLIYDYGIRQAWLSVGFYATINVPFWAWAMYAGAVIKAVALLIAFGTFIPTWQGGGPSRTLAAMLWAMVFYIAAVYVVFASPHWRYTEPVIPGLVLLAGLGLHALRKPPISAGIRGVGSPALRG